ncbi:hypothetical protein PPERSA_00207 [Pseudocohnilembus persalinus]|uniref:Uncharacterized protein n=1 Tax=Pseudocohnilembus persalinus TaxID=266149 RepID=A0A0V0QQC3_PSEPJ|nr:hypothetical protein PPERSA_00207 [Pseudocohnilembus persalinus]|eukprot:KRX04438.1 hypothetical protein PPERSA_00207 [Pseudocohnilembus persalinus]
MEETKENNQQQNNRNIKNQNNNNNYKNRRYVNNNNNFNGQQGGPSNFNNNYNNNKNRNHYYNNQNRNYQQNYVQGQNFRNFQQQQNFYQGMGNQNYMQGFPQQQLNQGGMIPINQQLTFQQTGHYNQFQRGGYMQNQGQFYGGMGQGMQQKGYKYKLQFKGTMGQQKEVIKKLQQHNKFRFEQVQVINRIQDQETQNGLIKFQYILTFNDKQEAKKCMFHNHLRHIKLQEEQNRPKLIMKRIVSKIGQNKIQEDNRVQVEAQEGSEGGVRGIYLFAIKSGVVYKTEQIRNERGKYQIYFESNQAAKKKKILI